jgi:mevalonate kinase
MDSIAELAGHARAAIVAGDRAGLGQLMQHNHELLRQLGVSTAALDAACQTAIQLGAWGAKLTGAGGGGCVIALVDPDTRAVLREAWAARSFACLEASASGCGAPLSERTPSGVSRHRDQP